VSREASQQKDWKQNHSRISVVSTDKMREPPKRLRVAKGELMHIAEAIWLIAFLAGIFFAVKNHRELSKEIKEGKWEIK
jgi:hypothetical protein